MTRPTVAVIGAGFGGLALAIRLQSAGVQTIVLEKRDRPGGRAYVYEQDGFTFDAGPTVITAPNVIDELFALSGRHREDYVEMLPVDPFYRLVWPDGVSLDYNADEHAVAAAIARIEPRDAEGYRRFLAYSEAVFREGYLKLGSVPFQDPWRMIRALPALIRLRSDRSVYDVVAKHLRDPHLRQAFSFQSLLIGGNPFHVSAIYALIHALERRWGVCFPRGGTGALVQALARLLQELGGEIRLDSPVECIQVKNGRAREVITAGGRHIAVDAVASNADVVHSYGKLLGETARGRTMAARLAGMRHSNSLFIVYFGLRRPYPELAHHTVLFGPRYRELLADIFEHGVLPEDFSLYLHNPSATDLSLAPPGQAGFYALAPVPHLGGGHRGAQRKARPAWRETEASHTERGDVPGIDWRTAGPRFRDRILDALERQVLPGLRANLLTSRIFTPEDFAGELNAYHGSAFSLEPVLTQSAWFRVHNRDNRIGNLYFVGAGTHPGAGVPGVIGSAQATASLMLPDLGAG